MQRASLRPKPLDFTEASDKLLVSVTKLLDSAQTVTPREFQFMFQDVYALCTAYPQPFTKELYARMRIFLAEHVHSCRQRIESVQSDLLKVYQDTFKVFYWGCQSAHKAFAYLNKEMEEMNKATNMRFGVATGLDNEYLHIEALAFRLWRDDLIKPLQERLVHAVLTEFEKDRGGDASSLSHVLTDVLDSLIKVAAHEKSQLDLYVQTFEVPFLEASKQFYQREASDCLANFELASYLVKAQVRLEEEELRGSKVLHVTTQVKLKAVCVKVLVEDNRTSIESECKNFIERQQYDNLRRMYLLLGRIPDGFSVVLHVLEDFISNDGLKRIEVLKREVATLTPAQYVETVWELHSHYDALWKDALASAQVFQSAIDKALRRVVNERLPGAVQSPELLAKHCDALLRKTNKIASDSELDEKVNQLITIFRYVDDKDIFQKFYAKNLAKRLIHANSTSDDAETNVINRLKQLCGFEYTSKLQQMFTDIKLSEELNTRFNQSPQGSSLGLQFHIMVLQSGAWPLGQATINSFVTPRSLEPSIQAFEGFYEGCHSGRKLSWLHHLGTAEVKATYAGNRTFEFSVSTFQMAILVLFNDETEFTVEQLQASTTLNLKELDRTLRSLLVAKLLLCDDLPEDSLPLTAVFSINGKYSNKKKKVKLSSGVQRETTQEAQSTRTAVDEDRKLFLQAAIVRVMKTRKTLTYQILIKEVVEHSKTRFKPDIPIIKKCIEDLMEKQYLERHASEANVLNYIA